MALLGILKIIGIVLLCIICFLLVLLCLLLFAPFRYKVSGSFHENVPDGQASVKWLLGVLGFKAAYHKGEKLSAFVTVCGFKVYNVLGGKDKEEETDELSESLELPEDEDTIMPVSTTPSGSIYCAEEKTDSAKALADAGKKPAALPSQAASKAEASEHVESGKKKERQSLSEKLREIRDGIKDRIGQSFRKLEEAVDAKINKLKETVLSIRAAVTDKTDKAKALYALYKDEQYEAAVAMVKKRVLRLLKELRPRKGRGKVRYGSNDPYSTAKTMQIAAFLYPLYGDAIEVIPDFDQAVIDADIHIKGRIRLFIAAEAALRIFFSKKLRRMYKKARRILDLD